MKIITVSQNVYSTFDEDFDTGFYPISAEEVRAKLVSRQNIFEHYGAKNVDFEKTDTMQSCGDIN